MSDPEDEKSEAELQAALGRLHAVVTRLVDRAVKADTKALDLEAEVEKLREQNRILEAELFQMRLRK